MIIVEEFLFFHHENPGPDNSLMRDTMLKKKKKEQKYGRIIIMVSNILYSAFLKHGSVNLYSRLIQQNMSTPWHKKSETLCAM